LTTANLPGDVYLVFHERLVRAWRETGDEANEVIGHDDE
jgi:hypothetical protein